MYLNRLKAFVIKMLNPVIWIKVLFFLAGNVPAFIAGQYLAELAMEGFSVERLTIFLLSIALSVMSVMYQSFYDSQRSRSWAIVPSNNFNY